MLEEDPRHVKAFLDGLTPRERIIVGLYYYDDGSPEAIARRLGMSTYKVKRVLATVREKFRAVLEREDRQSPLGKGRAKDEPVWPDVAYEFLKRQGSPTPPVQSAVAKPKTRARNVAVPPQPAFALRRWQRYFLNAAKWVLVCLPILGFLVAVLPTTACACREVTLKSSLDGLLQQHISVAIKWLGEPTGTLVLTGDPGPSAVWPLWVATSRHTLSGNTPKFGIGTLYAWSSSGDGNTCLINLYSYPNGVVTGAAVSADSAGCKSYADLLRRVPRKALSFCGPAGVDPCLE